MTSNTRTAVCVSGHCHGLPLVYKNIRKQLLEQLGSYDVFMYIVDDDNARFAVLLQPTTIVGAKDSPISSGNFAQCWVNADRGGKYSLNRYLQQINGYRCVNQLRVQHEQKSGIVYDFVVRLRPDTAFLEPVDPDRLDSTAVNIPDDCHYGGLNDKFAWGPAKSMNVYMNLIDWVLATDDLKLGSKYARANFSNPDYIFNSYNAECVLHHRLIEAAIDVKATPLLQVVKCVQGTDGLPWPVSVRGQEKVFPYATTIGSKGSAIG